MFNKREVELMNILRFLLFIFFVGLGIFFLFQFEPMVVIDFFKGGFN